MSGVAIKGVLHPIWESTHHGAVPKLASIHLPLANISPPSSLIAMAMIASGLPHEWWLMRRGPKKRDDSGLASPASPMACARSAHRRAPCDRQPTAHRPPQRGQGTTACNWTCAGLSMNKHKQRAEGAECGRGMAEKGDHKGSIRHGRTECQAQALYWLSTIVPSAAVVPARQVHQSIQGSWAPVSATRRAPGP